MLANEVTKLCHNEEKSNKAENEAKSILTSNKFNFETLKNTENKIVLNLDQIYLGITIKQILIDLKLCNSNGEAKRLIDQKAVKINKEIIKDKDLIIDIKNLLKNLIIKIST